MRDRNDILLCRDPSCGLRVVVPGAGAHDDVRIRRALPLSDPGHYVAVLDKRGNEICLIRDPNELDRESQLILEEELQRL